MSAQQPLVHKPSIPRNPDLTNWPENRLQMRIHNRQLVTSRANPTDPMRYIDFLFGQMGWLDTIKNIGTKIVSHLPGIIDTGMKIASGVSSAIDMFKGKGNTSPKQTEQYSNPTNNSGGIGSTIGNIISGVGSAFSSIKNGIHNFMSNPGQGISSIASGISNGIKAVGQGVGLFNSKAGEKVSNFGQKSDNVVDKGKQIVSSVGGGVSSLLKGLQK